MLSEAADCLRGRAIEARLYGQEVNNEAWAVCQAGMLLKGNNNDSIVRGDVFTQDGYGNRFFDYMLANPPFGVSWRHQQQFIKNEHKTLGWDGRFGAGTPRINDGSLLFLQHMLSKMAPDGSVSGSRVAVVFNGSPLFTGDADSGESNIRRWIIENDWLEAIVALPDQIFYNTSIPTYIWLLTNCKTPERVGKIQLIDGRQFFTKMRKSLGNKRNEISQSQIDDLARIYSNFKDGETRDLPAECLASHEPRIRSRAVSKIFNNEDFGYRKITVERPLRLNFAATSERIARLEGITKTKKRSSVGSEAEVRARQQQIRGLLEQVKQATSGAVIRDRDVFIGVLSDQAQGDQICLSSDEHKAVLNALGERDPEAEICYDRHGSPEPDPTLRDTERVPLNENLDEYLTREILPHFTDAWIDHNKTKTGYEIAFNKQFYVYEPPRCLEDIEKDLIDLETETERLFAGLFGAPTATPSIGR